MGKGGTRFIGDAVGARAGRAKGYSQKEMEKVLLKHGMPFSSAHSIVSRVSATSSMPVQDMASYRETGVHPEVPSRP